MPPTTQTARLPATVLLWLGAAWAAAVLTAPWLVASDGSVALRIAGAAVYDVAARVCHQRPDRSFVAAGLPWPICGRCAGLYLAFAAAAVAASAVPALRVLAARLTLPAWRVAICVALVPTLVSWGLERAHLVSGSPAARAWLAVPGGVVLALLLHALRSGGGSGPEVD